MVKDQSSKVRPSASPDNVVQLTTAVQRLTEQLQIERAILEEVRDALRETVLYDNQENAHYSQCRGQPTVSTHFEEEAAKRDKEKRETAVAQSNFGMQQGNLFS